MYVRQQVVRDAILEVRCGGPCASSGHAKCKQAASCRHDWQLFPSCMHACMCVQTLAYTPPWSSALETCLEPVELAYHCLVIASRHVISGHEYSAGPAGSGRCAGGAAAHMHEEGAHVRFQIQGCSVSEPLFSFAWAKFKQGHKPSNRP